MKIADLLNEHGLKLFAGANVLFGFLWGFFGLAIIYYGNPVIGSVMIAMNIAFLIRNRLDYLNHQIASTIIILGGIILGDILIPELVVFYFVFLIFGYLKDYADDVLHAKGIFAWLSELMLYYPIPTLIYGLIYNEWSLFLVFTTYTVFYNLTKYIAKARGYK